MNHEKKGREWTIEEDCVMAMQVAQQLAALNPSRGSLKFDQMVVVGRTPRAISERWNKMKSVPVVPSMLTQGAPATFGTPGSGKSGVDGSPALKNKADGDVETQETSAPAKKRKVHSAKKRAKAELNDEEQEMSLVTDHAEQAVADEDATSGMGLLGSSSPSSSYYPEYPYSDHK